MVAWGRLELPYSGWLADQTPVSRAIGDQRLSTIAGVDVGGVGET